MIAATPTDPHGANQFCVQMERIRRDCPLFVTWLSASLAETRATVEVTDGTAHFREVGAMRDLKTILDTIATPPAMPEFDSGQGGHGDAM